MFLIPVTRRRCIVIPAAIKRKRKVPKVKNGLGGTTGPVICDCASVEELCQPILGNSRTILVHKKYT